MLRTAASNIQRKAYASRKLHILAVIAWEAHWWCKVRQGAPLHRVY